MSISDARGTFLLAGLVVPFHQARAHNEDVAGAELDVLRGSYGVKIGHADLMAVGGFVAYPLRLGPGEVVEEHAARYDTASFAPIWVEGNEVLADVENMSGWGINWKQGVAYGGYRCQVCELHRRVSDCCSRVWSFGGPSVLY